MSASDTATQPRSWKTFLVVLLLCEAVALALYWRTLSYGFLSTDDLTYVVRNPLTTRLTQLRPMLTEFYFTDYLPVLQVFLASERALFGSPQPVEALFDSSGYHATSVLMHGLNGALLFFLIRHFLREDRRAAAAAAAGAAIFLAHPVQAETVAWIAEQKSLLATALLLGSLLCYARFRDGDCPARGWYACSMLIGACAPFAKSSAVVLPVLMVLYDICVAKRRWWRSLAAASPMIAVAAAASVTTLLSQARSGAISAEQGGPPLVMLLTMLPIFGEYVRMVALPWRLAYFYHTPLRDTPFSTAVLLGLAVTLLYLLALWLTARRNRPALFWLAWYGVALVPVLNIVPLNTLMADRYLYLPLAGVGGLAALAICRASRRQATLIGSLAAIALLGILTMDQTSGWRDDRAMWGRSLLHAPQQWKPWYNMASAYRDQASRRREKDPAQAAGLLARAVRGYRECLSRFDRNPATLNALGGVLWESGEREEALLHVRHALEIAPQDALAHTNLGQMLIQQGQLEEGAAHLEVALQNAAGSKEVRAQVGFLRQLLEATRARIGRGD